MESIDTQTHRKELTNQLEYLLANAMENPELRSDFYKTLLEAELFVLTDEHVAKEGDANGNKNIRIVTLKDGRIPVFTSTERMFDNGVIKEEVPFISMLGRTLMETTKGSVLWLNPFSDAGKELVQPEIEGLLNGTIFGAPQQPAVQQETKVRIGPPAQLPEGLEDSVIGYAMQRPEIDEAHIALIERIGISEKPNLMLGLKVSSHYEEIFKEIGTTVKEFIPKESHLEVIKIDGKEGLSAYFEAAEPLYKKS